LFKKKNKKGWSPLGQITLFLSYKIKDKNGEGCPKGLPCVATLSFGEGTGGRERITCPKGLVRGRVKFKFC